MPILLFIGSIMGLFGGLIFLKYKLYKCHNNNNIENVIINYNDTNDTNDMNDMNDNIDLLPKYEDVIKTNDDILPNY